MFSMLDSSRSTTRPEPQPGYRTFRLSSVLIVASMQRWAEAEKSLNLTTRFASNVYVPQGGSTTDERTITHSTHSKILLSGIN
jgi:hypothetical protein